MDVLVDNRLIPLRVQALLGMFGSSFVLSAATRSHTTRGHSRVQIKHQTTLCYIYIWTTTPHINEQWVAHSPRHSIGLQWPIIHLHWHLWKYEKEQEANDLEKKRTQPRKEKQHNVEQIKGFFEPFRCAVSIVIWAWVKIWWYCRTEKHTWHSAQPWPDCGDPACSRNRQQSIRRVLLCDNVCISVCV